MNKKILGILLLVTTLEQNAIAQNIALESAVYTNCVLSAVNSKNASIKNILTTGTLSLLKSQISANSRQLSVLQGKLYYMSPTTRTGIQRPGLQQPVVLSPYVASMQRDIALLNSRNLLLSTQYNQILSRSMISINNLYNYSMDICESRKAATIPSLVSWAAVWEATKGDLDQLASIGNTPSTENTPSTRTSLGQRGPVSMSDLTAALSAIGLGSYTFGFTAHTAQGPIEGSFTVSTNGNLLDSVAAKLDAIEAQYGSVTVNPANSSYGAMAALEASVKSFEDQMPQPLSDAPLEGATITDSYGYGFGSDSTPDGANTPDGGNTPSVGPR